MATQREINRFERSLRSFLDRIRRNGLRQLQIQERELRGDGQVRRASEAAQEQLANILSQAEQSFRRSFQAEGFSAGSGATRRQIRNLQNAALAPVSQGLVASTGPVGRGVRQIQQDRASQEPQDPSVSPRPPASNPSVSPPQPAQPTPANPATTSALANLPTSFLPTVPRPLPAPPQQLTNSQAASLLSGIEGIRSNQQQAAQTAIAGGTGRAPATGLIGSEAALQGGLQGGLGAIISGVNQARGDIQQSVGTAQNTLQGLTEGSRRNLRGATDAATASLLGGRDAARGAFSAASERLGPFASEGVAASNLQAALSGALGPEAQRQAFSDFTESPGQAFLTESAERALTRNAAAIGGLGGGRVLDELQRQAVGLAQQDLNNQFARLGEVASRGAGAASTQAGLDASRAGLEAEIGRLLGGTQQTLGQNIADVNAQRAQQALALQQFRGGQLAQLGLTGGLSAANLTQGTAQQVAQGRTRAGEQIANQIAGTSGGLAQLAQQQGSGLADILAQNTGSIANLLVGAGQNQSAAQQQLATLLANIGTGAGSQVGALPPIPGVQNQPGILGGLGQVAEGAGGLITALRTPGPAALSDVRFKKSIVEVARLSNGLLIYKWVWNSLGNLMGKVGEGLGVLAQEVYQTYPDKVYVEKGIFKVDYNGLVGKGA